MVQATLATTIGGNVHTFNFAGGMIQKVSSSITAGVDPINVPKQGPMAGYGTDIEPVTKTITVNGTLFDVTSSVVTGTSAPTILTKRQMKFWLEAILNGNQDTIAKTFVSNFEDYSLQNSSGSTTIDGVSIPGTWLPTTIITANITFDEEEASPDKLIFTMQLTVLGGLS